MCVQEFRQSCFTNSTYITAQLCICLFAVMCKMKVGTCVGEMVHPACLHVSIVSVPLLLLAEITT